MHSKEVLVRPYWTILMEMCEDWIRLFGSSVSKRETLCLQNFPSCRVSLLLCILCREKRAVIVCVVRLPKSVDYRGFRPKTFRADNIFQGQCVVGLCGVLINVFVCANFKVN